MSTREILALQGVSLNNVAGYESCMTERQLRAVAGNAVPVPLLARVLHMLLHSAGRA